MNTDGNLLKSFTYYSDKVQDTLREVIDGCSSNLNDILLYHMGWQDENGNPCQRESSKFIRSLLCILSCQAVGGNVLQILPAAAALELIHNFSLIHDDIQDSGYERHHQPTIWRLWGKPQAINAGDAMFTLVYLALLKLRNNQVPAGKIVDCTEMLSRVCSQLCEGQYLDIEYEARLDISINDYLKMAEKKTAVLFAASTSLGVFLVNEDKQLINNFRLFGKELGMAYQIHDDILGIWGMEDNTGKSTNDILQRKKTLPVVYALKHCKSEDKTKLKEFYLRESAIDSDIYRIIDILDNVCARDYAWHLAEQYYSKALEQLRATGLDTTEQTSLRKIASFLLKRDY